MAEMVDLYSRLRRPLNRTGEVGSLPAGTYYARVSAWVGNNRGAFLMLRRADTGVWTVPTTNVKAGETPFGAAKRAVLNELGLTFDAQNAKHFSSERKDNLGIFRDVYLFRGSACIEDVVVDGVAYSDVAWLMPAEIEQAHTDGQLDEFLEYYYDLVYPE